MDITTQLGMEIITKWGLPTGACIILMFVLIKQYLRLNDRAEKREDEVREESKVREERLMQTLDQQGETLGRIASTLDRLDMRISYLEEKVNT